MDAVSYFDAVKNQLRDQPVVYKHFLGVMKEFKNKQIDAPVVIQRVSQLFRGHPVLMEGFNAVFPVWHQIEGSSYQQDGELISLTTQATTESPSSPASATQAQQTRSSARLDPGYGCGTSAANAEHGGVVLVSSDPQWYASDDPTKNKRPRFDPPSQSSTSYGSYQNLGCHASGSGIITNATYYQYGPSSPLAELEKHCSHSAAFDSSARFDPPRCAESTRLGIIQIIEEWINSDGDGAMPSSLFWLHGGAGVGKSALAQSLSEQFQEREQLAASFFFFRGDPTRNNGDHLIPTLTSHLINTLEEIAPFIEDRIRKHRALFTKRHQIQTRELLVEPMLSLKLKGHLVTRPQLIVIDGLDECQKADVQCELLRVIAGAIPQIPYPFRFLVTSRPEAHITDVFHYDRNLQNITVHQYNLSDDPDADMDIRKFFEIEFVEIRRVHRLGRHLPHTWPDRKTICSLVERSSGHFIYASTVIRYIRSPKHRPDDRLEVILRLRPPQEGDRPYALLDALYTLIFQGVEGHGQLEKICLVLGILYFQSLQAGFFSEAPDNNTIEGLLDMKAGDLILLLDPILSLVAIDGGRVRMLHKSLIDYLLDFSRGGHLPFNLARVHELAASYILKERLLRTVCKIGDIGNFAYHCRYACLNDTLKNYLHSLEVPSPKSVKTAGAAFLCWDDKVHESLRSIIWDFFWTLRREAFNSTVHVQYVQKWMLYLVPKAIHQYEPTLNMKYMKTELETLLTKWSPQQQNPMDVGMDTARHAAIIKQEHDVFSAHALATFSGNTFSSLVFGDYFIHSYNLGISDFAIYMTLQTYSRHSNRCCRGSLRALVGGLVQETSAYLRRTEKYLCSELYQKYGVEEGNLQDGWGLDSTPHDALAKARQRHFKLRASLKADTI